MRSRNFTSASRPPKAVSRSEHSPYGVSAVIRTGRRALIAFPVASATCAPRRFPLRSHVTIGVTSLRVGRCSIPANPMRVPRWFFNWFYSFSAKFRWYLPDIEGREPDFILFGSEVGLLIFEVKDWALEQIVEANPHTFILKIGGSQ